MTGCFYSNTTIRLLLTLFVCLLQTGCEQPTSLQQVKRQKELIIVTRNSPTTYYQGKEQPTGFEFELAKRFAKELGVKLTIITANSLPDIFHALADNGAAQRISLAAAGLAVTDHRQRQVHFSQPYMDVTQQLIYNAKLKAPKSFADLSPGKFLVLAGSSHAERLKQYSDQIPIPWETTEVHENIDLLRMVNDGEIDYTVVDSNELAMNFIYFPNIRVAFDLAPSDKLAWAFPKSVDASLINRANLFFAKIKANGTLAHLYERFYGHVEQINYVGVKTFTKQMQKRLPKYRNYFEKAAESYDMDWRLLASIGYQESHWRPKAKSPTGVRGLMMLTRATAKEMGVANRLNPKQSIMGGSRYFKKIKARINQDIKEPDRTWMALAAYNVGYGHLQDARKLTEIRGGDPNKWVDVKESLPLLSKKQWHQLTKYGYARGYEPVLYVQNIRRYYDLLRWLTVPQIENLPVAKSEHSPGIKDG
ncbi:membrane-bound lytic murein transglycosylase MltF [Endozoicomonas sp. SM1973]|uniref:Membrane-bound lytic murein transglycosylase F n=1 Tax=Spartinivicinus marinus TaxID=2994442 RepID=A0A853HTY6_9GAMM|nr:membrane-bound lytic murein transglycosylase MltF [Spartinivicinus marinus]MCX4025541.1 membrane-bound lytic murein transglycosylase MltF [Spartinivicinus marinus]NYZ65230.1 membrane-bound lytic murein transglycosylase MltF [Spartinivicinus marinus]